MPEGSQGAILPSLAAWTHLVSRTLLLNRAPGTSNLVIQKPVTNFTSRGVKGQRDESKIYSDDLAITQECEIISQGPCPGTYAFPFHVALRKVGEMDSPTVSGEPGMRQGGGGGNWGATCLRSTCWEHWHRTSRGAVNLVRHGGEPVPVSAPCHSGQGYVVLDLIPLYEEEHSARLGPRR